MMMTEQKAKREMNQILTAAAAAALVAGIFLIDFSLITRRVHVDNFMPIKSNVNWKNVRGTSIDILL